MALVPKPAPRYLNKASTDFVIKWMSRGNTWLYKTSGGRWGAFEKAPVALLTTT
jgi:hypothetical protein